MTTTSHCSVAVSSGFVIALDDTRGRGRRDGFASSAARTAASDPFAVS
jgi:hypothetical protein